MLVDGVMRRRDIWDAHSTCHHLHQPPYSLMPPRIKDHGYSHCLPTGPPRTQCPGPPSHPNTLERPVNRLLAVRDAKWEGDIWLDWKFVKMLEFYSSIEKTKLTYKKLPNCLGI